MKINKYILFIFICCLFVVSDIAAGGLTEWSGGNDARLFYLPRNVANNGNVMIELSQAHTVLVGDIENNYSNSTTGNYNILRLRNNLYNKDQTVQNGTTITISVKNNDWSFVNENNPTQKVPFGLNAFCVEKQIDKDRSYDTDVSTFPVSNSVTTNAPSMSKDGDQYKLFMPYSEYVQKDWSMFSQYIREYDLCVLLPNTSENVEPGYYSTTITLISTSYYEYTAKSSGEYVTKMQKDTPAKTFSETITIRGYVGLEPGTSSGNCSFSVTSTADTYSMDLRLKTQSDPYVVANVDLQSIDLVTKNKPDAATQIGKYTVYISPTSDYNVAGSYRFIRMNSENQARTDENTIYYDLYIKPENTYVKLSSLGASGDNSAYSNYTNNVAKNTSYKIGNAFALASPVDSLNDNTKVAYGIRPLYEIQTIADSGLMGGDDQWKETWNLNQNIYLKIADRSLNVTHQAGLYYSYIYFTLVTN